MEVYSEKTRAFICDKNTGDVIRGIAIILLFLGHSGWFPRIESGTVSLFLLLSGYGLTVSWLNKGLSHFWIKKAAKVYLPYLIVTTFILLVDGCKSKKMILFSLMGLDFGHLKIGTMWYISFQLFWYIAFYVSAQITTVLCRANKVKTLQNVILALLTFSFIFPCVKLESIGTWHDAVGAFLYYYMFPVGVLLGCLSEMMVSKKTKLLLWIAMLAVTSGLVVKYGNNIGNRNEYTIFASALGLMIMSLSQCIIRKTKDGVGYQLRGEHGSIENTLVFLGGLSYSLYLWEGIIASKAYSWTNLSIRELQDVVYFVLTVICGFLFQKVIVDRIDQCVLKCFIETSDDTNEEKAISKLSHRG